MSRPRNPASSNRPGTRYCNEATRKFLLLATFPHAMGTGLRLTAGGALLAVAISGCGGGERQDKNEPEGTFDLAVVEKSFPLSQHVARQSRLRIEVRNTGQRTVPNVAVTVRGFGARDPQPGLADPNRPIWIVDSGPKGGDTAYVSTWALGSLGPGRTRTFEWRVTPTRAGQFDVKYEIAAGLDGKAKARSVDGRPPGGSFSVRVSGKPADARVDPDSGRVIREQD